MSDAEPATDTGPGAAPAHPEPEWVTRAADAHGWLWVRRNWLRASSVPGAWFDTKKADGIVEAFPRLFKLTILQFAGVEFHLSFWQECIVRLLFGWKHPVDVVDPRTKLPGVEWVRVFQELRLWIPRKAGKTEFLAALALLVWYYEGLTGAEGYVFARDEKQAAIPFNRMKLMAASSTDLRNRVRRLATQLWCQNLISPFFLITAKAEGKHGRAPYVTLGDEMHEWRSTDLADNLREGSGPYLQPLRLYASTAGLKSQETGRGLFDESKRILAHDSESPEILVAMFAAEDEDDWTDEKVWARVNPNIGISPTWQFMRQEYALAKRNPAAEAKFRCYHLNQWVEDYQRWIPLRVWDAAIGDKDGWKKWPDEIGRGRDCIVSFDATEVWDFAMLCARFAPVDDGEKVKLVWKFFLPEATIKKRAEQEGREKDYDRWVKTGQLVSIPGEVFELQYAIATLREWRQRWNILKIGYDPWNAASFYTELVNPRTEDKAIEEDLFVKMRFGHKTLGEATRKFESQIYGSNVTNGGNEIARYMMQHCHVRYDENMNIVPAKKKSHESGGAIDGIVGAVMCEALAMPPREESIDEIIKSGGAVL